jgi:hypothetical protein
MTSITPRRIDAAPFHNPTQRAEAFRAYIRQLDDAETVELLGWLLDTGINDPCPDMSEDLIDALMPVSEAFRKSYDALELALELADHRKARERADDEADYRYEQYRDRIMEDQMYREAYVERVSPAVYGSAVA